MELSQTAWVQGRACAVKPPPPVPQFAPLDDGDNRVIGTVTGAGHPVRLSSLGLGGGPSHGHLALELLRPGLGALMARRAPTPGASTDGGPTECLREAGS